MIPGPKVPPFVFGWQYYNNVVTPLYLLLPHNQPAVAISGLPILLGDDSWTFRSGYLCFYYRQPNLLSLCVACKTNPAAYIADFDWAPRTPSFAA
jgi:hypothetical protein